MAATIMGCGIPLEKSLIYWQSHVPQHAELMWLLSCFSSLGYLSRMPQYMEKSKKHVSAMNLGLYRFTPVLQAADILLFESQLVPVGEDQCIHINFTRDLVDSVHAFYGKPIFTKPETYLLNDDETSADQNTVNCARVMSLRDASSKMSKSDPSSMSRIDLIDSLDDIVTKIGRAVTDSYGPFITYDTEKRPGLANLIRIYSAVSDMSIAKITTEFQNYNTAKFKEACAVQVNSHLAPIREEIMRLRKDKSFVKKVMTENAKEAKEIAEQTMKKVRKELGFVGL
ncbi:hypothetical protein RFI_39168 [Reticulomyxa filosa]|uniref:tryptophan--tRNA ligase n=1 Tax=Reticulomyxa filosa TaxID=46433 RepID=X6LB37_RETFI|nr:hypothetical protein RFI_39168 [Reticulomyxa filosa]|eukprot:ETN98341.1 hypothetical protein RFI_39168 [Reticulomyxa filosa]